MEHRGPTFTVSYVEGGERCCHGDLGQRQLLMSGPGIGDEPRRYNVGCAYDTIVRLLTSTSADDDSPVSSSEPKSRVLLDDAVIPIELPEPSGYDDPDILPEFRGAPHAYTIHEFVYPSSRFPGFKETEFGGTYRLYPEYGRIYPRGARQLHVSVYESARRGWVFRVREADSDKRSAHERYGFDSRIEALAACYREFVLPVLTGKREI